MIYVFLALHFLLRLRIKFKKTPLLTLPQARRQLAAVIPLRSLSLKGTMEIIEYHMQRNLIAYESHRKKNEEVAQKLNAKVSL